MVNLICAPSFFTIKYAHVRSIKYDEEPTPQYV